MNCFSVRNTNINIKLTGGAADGGPGGGGPGGGGALELGGGGAEVFFNPIKACTPVGGGGPGGALELGGGPGGGGAAELGSDGFFFVTLFFIFCKKLVFFCVTGGGSLSSLRLSSFAAVVSLGGPGGPGGGGATAPSVLTRPCPGLGGGGAEVFPPGGGG